MCCKRGVSGWRRGVWVGVVLIVVSVLNCPASDARHISLSGKSSSRGFGRRRETIVAHRDAFIVDATSPQDHSSPGNAPAKLRYASHLHSNLKKAFALIHQEQKQKQNQYNKYSPPGAFLARKMKRQKLHKDDEQGGQGSSYRGQYSPFGGHSALYGNFYGGSDDDEEESGGGYFNGGRNEDHHLYQERYKSSKNNAPVVLGEDDERSEEQAGVKGSGSLVNSYFDSEYSLNMLQRMECITPAKSKGYCSTFRGCVPSLFNSEGKLEAPALAELVSMSIGYCTTTSARDEGNLLRMGVDIQRFTAVSNRIICCPGSPPLPGGSAEENSAEKFNDFLSGSGTFTQEENDFSQGASNKDKKPIGEDDEGEEDSIKEDLKGEFVAVHVDTDSEVWTSEELVKAGKRKRPENVIPIEAFIPLDKLSSYNPHTNTFSKEEISSQDKKGSGQEEKESGESGENSVNAGSESLGQTNDEFMEDTNEKYSGEDKLSFDEGIESVTVAAAEVGGSGSGSPVKAESVMEFTVEANYDKGQELSVVSTHPEGNNQNGSGGIKVSSGGGSVEPVTEFTVEANYDKNQEPFVISSHPEEIHENETVTSHPEEIQNSPTAPPTYQSEISATPEESISENDEFIEEANAHKNEHHAPTFSEEPPPQDEGIKTVTQEPEAVHHHDGDNSGPHPLDEGIQSVTQEAEPVHHQQGDNSGPPPQDEGIQTVTQEAVHHHDGDNLGPHPQDEGIQSLTQEAEAVHHHDGDNSGPHPLDEGIQSLTQEAEAVHHQQGENSGPHPLDEGIQSLTQEAEAVHHQQGENSGPHPLDEGIQSVTQKAEAVHHQQGENSSFIKISPDPVIGANGKFNLEKGVHVEKATNTTPRPPPDPQHQVSIGVTTVNVVKGEATIDSNQVLLLHPHPPLQESRDKGQESGDRVEITRFPVNDTPPADNGDFSKTTTDQDEVPTTTRSPPPPLEEEKQGNHVHNFEVKFSPVETPEATTFKASYEHQNDEEFFETTFTPENPTTTPLTSTSTPENPPTTPQTSSFSPANPTTPVPQTPPSSPAPEIAPETLKESEITQNNDDHASTGNFLGTGQNSDTFLNQKVVPNIQLFLTDAAILSPQNGTDLVENEYAQSHTSKSVAQSTSTSSPSDIPLPPVVNNYPQPPTKVEFSSEENSSQSSEEIRVVTPTSIIKPEEIGGIGEKLPEYQILSSCATQDYYRTSLEQDNVKQYPYLATIVGGSRPFCSGTLITDRHILTASHFLANITVADVFHMRVHVGYRSVYGGQTEGPFAVRKVLKVVRHKGFSFDKLLNDIAIIVLDRPVHFSEDVHPVCLSNTPNLYSSSGGVTQAFETGWVEDPLMKRISPHHPFIDPHILKYFSFGYENVTWTLQESLTSLRSTEDCQFNYDFLGKSGIVITEAMVCAATEDGKSCAFKGNSGAPLFINREGKPIQIGLVSWGIGCGHFPAVFTQVSNYLPWIEKVVQKTSTR